MVGHFRVLPAPEMPGEHQASDPSADPSTDLQTASRLLGSKGDWRAPVRFISSASRWGGESNHQEKMERKKKKKEILPWNTSKENQDLKKKKNTVKRRNSVPKDLMWEIQMKYI